MRFALVTNDKVLQASLAEFLARDCVVVETHPGDLATLRAVRAAKYDVVLIDAQGGEPLANSMLAWHRCNAGNCTPVIVLSTFSTWRHMLEWINAGANDVANRLDYEQIRLRTQILLLRESDQAGKNHIDLCGYRLIRDTNLITLETEEIALTSREFAMAWLFFSHPGKFISRAQLASSVWGTSQDIASRTIEQHVYRLRKKLRLSSGTSLRLKTLYALGYKLDIVSLAPHDNIDNTYDQKNDVNRPDDMLVP